MNAPHGNKRVANQPARIHVFEAGDRFSVNSISGLPVLVARCGAGAVFGEVAAADDAAELCPFCFTMPVTPAAGARS